MLNATRRSWQQQSLARFLLTIELDPPADSHGFELHSGLARLTRELAALLDEHNLPVTWAVGDPAHSAATATVKASAVAHEIAILGDPTWLGPTAGRTRFARELARRVTQARREGIHVSALVPREASVAPNIDLIVKHQLTAVAGTEVAAGARCPQPRSLHYGVWEMPVGVRLPQESSWLFETWSLTRRIRQATRHASTLHLVVDAPAVELQGRSALRTVARLFRRVARLRDRELLEVVTLGGAAARLSALPASSPQRSILRPAA